MGCSLSRSVSERSVATEHLFPSGVHEQFEDLSNQVINLHMKWRFYLDLFDNEEAQEVMNVLLSGSFRIIEESVRCDLIITLYRIADVAVSAEGKKTEKRNLTLRSLLREVKEHIEVQFSHQLKCQLDALDAHLELLKEYRNKAVGHNDRETALGTRPVPLRRLERAHVEESAAMIGRFLNSVAACFGIPPTGYAMSHPLGGGRDLVEYLRRGWQHQEDEMIKYGIPTPVRWRPTR
jgi:hypothetical protein